jgi:UDP-N-acetylmuramoylalanine--D-glutamate ligase
MLVLLTDRGEERLIDRSDLSIAGPHNVSNALFAALACRLAGTPVEAIREGLRDFRALPHRLQRVATRGGVAFYDDSKATNPASTATALAAFPERSVHVILGGRDKGADWESLKPSLRRHARRVLLVGESASSLETILGDFDPVRCATVPEAVAEGYRAAAPGETVLLSPACASFDQYPGFAARGEDFQRAVAALDDRPPEASDA